MKVLGVLMIVLLLVFSATGLLDVRADDTYKAYKTGLMYAKGDGVTQDYSEALKWFREAADQGNSDAQRQLGLMYYDGIGVSKDYGEAFKWLQKAASQGHANAQYHIGWMYRFGKGTLTIMQRL